MVVGVTASRSVGLVGLAVCVTICASIARAEWKFSGYTQIRFNLWDDAVDDDSFDARRARLKVEGPVFDDTTSFKIQFDLAGLDDDHGEVELKDLLLTRKLGPDTKGALGFQSVPFGYEVPTSSSKRLPLERSEVARRFFPGERAIGAWFMYHPRPDGKFRPQVDVGYTNGMSKWFDADAAGDEDTHSPAWFIRAQVPITGSTGVAGVSFMGASRERDVAGVDTDFGSENVFGAHVRYDSDFGLNFQGEYFDGEILNEDTHGWLAMLEYELPQAPWVLFYRYDTCDRASKAIDYDRHTVGAAWELSKNERITVQGEFIDGYKYAATSVNNFGVQYQIKY